METTRLSYRWALLFLFGICLALWPLAGHAAPPAAIGLPDDVDEAAQLGLTVTKSANVAQASAGATIVYTYRVTNTGTVALSGITAVDSRLGAVAGIATSLAPNAATSATMNYVVQPGDAVGPLVNTVTVTGSDGTGGSVTATASTTVQIVSPTALERTEQPGQQRVPLFLPYIEP
jgi:hypothetical protein